MSKQCEKKGKGFTGPLGVNFVGLTTVLSHILLIVFHTHKRRGKQVTIKTTTHRSCQVLMRKNHSLVKLNYTPGRAGTRDMV